MIKSSLDCFQCSACACSCPKDAICFEPDQSSYLYPVVSEQKCINCGICASVCPLERNPTSMNRGLEKKAFIYSEPCSETSSSSSGGFCYEFSKFILNNGGLVYSAVFDEKTYSVQTKKIEDAHELDKARGSKYVKSFLGDTFISIKKNLENRRVVLFVGMPCEIAGLLCYLKKSYANLITLCLFCGGTISQEIFKTHLEHIERFCGAKIDNINFRKKTNKLLQYKTSVTLNNNGREIVLPEKFNLYMRILSSNFIRPSCKVCKLNQTDFTADLTIGDYHGNKTKKHSSLVFSNSSNCLVDKFLRSQEMVLTSLSIDEALNSARFRGREAKQISQDEYHKFVVTFKQNGLKVAFKKFIYKNYTLKQKVSYYTPRFIKKIIHGKKK